MQNNEANLSDILTRLLLFFIYECSEESFLHFLFLIRMNVRSDTLVRFFQPELVCQVCQGEGHTHRACPLASNKVGENISYQDYVFWCYVAPGDFEEFVEF